uniref:G_PROTEIN_RECEP_F1_2 domain-containing protein n=1 Tax=Steinernema glaseri TaxID=37863 RepID=A0A1I8A0V1_9BILA
MCGPKLADNTIPTMTLSLSSVGLVVNAVFIVLVARGLRNKLLPFKGYSLLLNRTITDLVVGFFTTLFVALHKFDTIQRPAPPRFNNSAVNASVSEIQLEYLIPHGRTAFTLLLTVNFWAVAGVYGVLSLLTFVAVRYPMYYKVCITNKRTVFIMIVIWVIGGVYSALVVSLSSNNAFNMFNSANDLIQWSVSDEDYVLAISNLLIVLISFVLVASSYAAIISYLWKKSNKSGKAGLHLVSIGRLALNIVLFTSTCIVMASFVALPLFLKKHIDDLVNTKSDCENAVKIYRLGYQMAIWTTIAMTGWMLRIILDPVTNLLLDGRFKDVINAMCSSSRRRDSLSASQVRARNFLSRTEFLQKCARMNVIPISILCSDGHYFRYRSSSEAEADRSGRRKTRRFAAHIHMDERVL